jgi:hypothetical protein
VSRTIASRAVVIVIVMGLGALAGLTESLKKLGDVLPSLSAQDVAGEWHTIPAEFYPIGPEVMVLRLQESMGNKVIGTIEFRTPPGEPRSDRFEVLDGKRDGKKLTLVFSTGAVLYSGRSAEPKVLQESVTGEMANGELRLLYQREGHGGISVTARRMPVKTGGGA